MTTTPTSIGGFICVYPEGIVRYTRGDLCIDIPAIVSTDGEEWWYINGELLQEKEFNERRKQWKDT